MSRVVFEILKIKNPIRQVGFYEYINIEIDVGEGLAIKSRRHVYIAIEPDQIQVGIAKPKDVVPAI